MLVSPTRLIKAVPLDDYKVHLRFADGLAADVDLSYLVGCGEVFEPLRDVEYFRKLRVDELGDRSPGRTKPTSPRRPSTTMCSAPSTRSGGR